jgi:3',5'-nucleoside bisphosphate phosphatase
MENFRADLHCHTTCSDGTVNPREIIQLACNLGLQGLSITDHDTIAAYKEAVPAAAAKNFPLISGAEFSAKHLKVNVHILAYGFSLSSSIIEKFCQLHHERRELRNQAILDSLATHGMPLSQEDFPIAMQTPLSNHSIGRPHIALAMVKKGYVHSIQQAFHEYIGEGKPCYALGTFVSAEETLDVIHKANGLAIIAHPHLIENVGILKDLLEMNFDGIEGYYARYPQSAIKRWLKIGQQKKWIITGGSDFHGEIKPNVPLGSSWANQETFEFLQQHYQHNQGSDR